MACGKIGVISGYDQAQKHARVSFRAQVDKLASAQTTVGCVNSACKMLRDRDPHRNVRDGSVNFILFTLSVKMDGPGNDKLTLDHAVLVLLCRVFSCAFMR